MDKRRFSSRGYRITLLAFYYRRPCTIHGCWTTALELHYNIDHSSIAPVWLQSRPSRQNPPSGDSRQIRLWAQADESVSVDSLARLRISATKTPPRAVASCGLGRALKRD